MAQNSRKQPCFQIIPCSHDSHNTHLDFAFLFLPLTYFSHNYWPFYCPLIIFAFNISICLSYVIHLLAINFLDLFNSKTKVVTNLNPLNLLNNFFSSSFIADLNIKTTWKLLISTWSFSSFYLFCFSFFIKIIFCLFFI